MTFNKICAVAAAVAIAFTGIGAMPVRASAETPEVYVLDDGTMEKQFIHTNKPGYQEITDSGIRMFDKTYKITPSSDVNRQFGSYLPGASSSEATEYGNDFQYKYANFWVYSPKALTAEDSDDGQNIPNITFAIYRGPNVGAMGALYKSVTVGWEGWKLVSIPIENMSYRNSKKLSDTFSNNGNTTQSNQIQSWYIFANWNQSGTDAIKWKANTGDYYLIDYVYLSKEAPPQEQSLTVTESSIADGTTNVPADLDGGNTLSLTMEHSLNANAVHTDKVTVTKNGEALSGGYAVSVDNNDSAKMNIIFENSLEPGAKYGIAANPGCVYDEYGYTLTTAYTTDFTVDSRVPYFKVMNNDPADGAENVPVDLGGARVYTVRFNTPPADADAAKNAVTVMQNGRKITKGYSVDISENVLKIRMDDDLKYGTEYTIEIAEGLQDIYGNTLEDKRSFTFTTAEPMPDIYEIAAFDSDGKIDTLLSKTDGTVITGENARLYERTLRFEIPAGSYTNGQLVGVGNLRGAFGPSEAVDFSDDDYKDYQYINYWIYSPTLPTNINGNPSTLNMMLFTKDGANEAGRFYYTLPVNWTGWKLISIPRSEFTATDSVSWNTPIKQYVINVNNYISAQGAVRWSDGGYVLIDKIFLSKEQPSSFAYAGSSLPQNYKGAPVKDMEVYFSYTGVISTLPKDAVLVKDSNGNAVTAFTAKAEENHLNVYFTEDLEPTASYTIEVDRNISDSSGQQVGEATVYSFTTAAADFSVGKPFFESTSGAELNQLPSVGERITVRAKFANMSAKAQSAVLTVAQYNSAGTMLDLAEATESVAVSESGEMSVQIEVKAETTAVRAFVRDADGNLLRTNYSVLGVEDAQARRIYGAAAAVTDSLSLDSAETYIDELRISGSYGGVGAVLLRITDEKGEQILTVPIYTGANGQFTYQYTFGKKSNSGSYTVSVSANGKVRTLKTAYLAAEDQEDLLNIANSDGEIAKISAFLKENQGALGLSGMSAARIEGIAQTVSEHKPYSSYGDVLDTIEKAKSILSDLNSAHWSSMTVLLAKNQGLVLYENKDYAYYAGLSDENRNLINQAIAKGLPVDSFVKFRTLFSNAVADYKAGKLDNKTNAGSSGSGGGGGSGGDGGGTSVGLSADIVSEYANGTVSAVSGENNNAVFVDLETSAWAKESIAQLYELGVISPAEDKKFRPEDSVTRAEFVKLLVVAFGMELTEENSGFTDAADGEWYQPYLAAARAAGMIEGSPDGSFGIENPITRQDMATMAYRAVTALNKTLRADAESESFSDAADIADYARTAVDAIQRAGVINGMGDGSFCPLQQASRAQAAKIISGLLNAVG